MHNNRQLYWGQGLFLTPQHLQQQDLFHEHQRHFFWRLGHPHGWGISRLRIREEGLKANLFELLECEFVSRDGILLRTGTETDRRNAELGPRNFKDFMDPTGGSLSVYIGLPRYQPGHPNLTSEKTLINHKGAITRYRLAEQMCADLFDVGSHERDIQFIEYNLMLLFHREETFSSADQAFELIKIAELSSLPDGTGARLYNDYIPPCLTVSASDFLLRRLRDIRDLLTNRAQEFAGMKRQRGIRATASTIQELLRLIMLQSLNRYVPLFHHALESGYTHPEAMYALLRQVVGELSSFSEEVTVLGSPAHQGESTPGLPTYDHEALQPCFDLAISRVRELITSMTHGPETGIRLSFDGEYYRASLSDDVFQGERTRYYLMIDNPMNGEELWALLQRKAKISTLADMPRLRQSALFGLKIHYLPVPPEELPQRGTQYSYFAIDTHSPHWQRIQTAGDIAVFCDLDPNETVIKLFVVHGE